MDGCETVLEGGGPVGIALNISGSAYDYSPWGNNAHAGYVSTDFASNIVTDLTIGGASTVVGISTGIASVALTGAVAGSVVPGIGTILGLAAGIGFSLFMSQSSRGQAITNRIQKSVKKAMDKGVQVAKDVGESIGNTWNKATSWFGSS